MFNTVSMIGLGYIGLPTAAVFASKGINVIGVDVNERTVNTVNRGEIHIVEPDLEVMVRDTVASGTLRATTVPEPADAFIIAVPTPFAQGYKPDLSYIESAAKMISAVLKPGDLVILESTSPVGATEQLTQWLADLRPDLALPDTNGTRSDIHIAYCPERVLPGHVISELVSNDRLIGGMSEACSQLAVQLYKTFVEGECVITNARTAEMAKLTENSFRDVNIAFANELSVICDQLDINVWQLIELANRHPRVNILQPGPGVGGHCIAVDPWFIVSKTPELARLIETARNVNDDKPFWILSKVEQAISDIVHHTAKTVGEIKIACFGVAFKANIDDLRESPALEISQMLASKYPSQVHIVEPNIDALPEQLVAHGAALDTLEQAIERCDVLVMLVDHQQFKTLQPTLRDDQSLIDSKGIWCGGKL